MVWQLGQRNWGYLFLILAWFLTGCSIPTPQDPGVSDELVDRATEQDERFLSIFYMNDSNFGLPVRLFVPANQDSAAKYPLILYLHGSESRGYDNIAQIANNLSTHIWIGSEMQAQYPCFVLAPQCGLGRYWQDFTSSDISWELRAVLAILDDLQTKYPIDPDRLYIVGHWMGSYGTWDLICKRPDVFAAAVPISAGGDPFMAHRVVDLPIWAFHGTADRYVPLSTSRNMIKFLRDAGGNPRYTEYLNEDGDITSLVYQEPEFFSWLFSQKRLAQ